jgi:hypothetical protein
MHACLVEIKKQLIYHGLLGDLQNDLTFVHACLTIKNGELLFQACF